MHIMKEQIQKKIDGLNVHIIRTHIKIIIVKLVKIFFVEIQL